MRVLLAVMQPRVLVILGDLLIMMQTEHCQHDDHHPHPAIVLALGLEAGTSYPLPAVVLGATELLFKEDCPSGT